MLLYCSGHPWSPPRSHPPAAFPLAVTPVTPVPPCKGAGAKRISNLHIGEEFSTDPCLPWGRATDIVDLGQRQQAPTLARARVAFAKPQSRVASEFPRRAISARMATLLLATKEANSFRSENPE